MQYGMQNRSRKNDIPNKLRLVSGVTMHDFDSGGAWRALRCVFAKSGRNHRYFYTYNKCIGEDTKCVAHQSPNCIRKTKKYVLSKVGICPITEIL